MSSQSTLVGVGPYDPDSAFRLNYPEGWYEGCGPGRLIVDVVVACETTSSSRELAEALGFRLSDMHLHVLEGSDVIAREAQLLEYAADWEQYRESVDWLLFLARRGWAFLFLPES